MFSKIIVALNDLPESQRALRMAIDLADKFDASLLTASILGDPPAYTSFTIAIDPGAPAALKEDRRRIQTLLHKEATKLAQAILLPRKQKADLLVIGLHQHDFYLSGLWSSVYDVAQDATCSVLGVH
jgi:nucleotide-binding universal stress UspA family protein